MPGHAEVIFPFLASKRNAPVAIGVDVATIYPA